MATINNQEVHMYPTPLSHAANDEVIPVQKYFTATASQTQITVN
jgi:hypothetical protein